FQTHFRCRKEQDSHFRRLRENFGLIENLVVQGNGEGAEAEIARALEQLMRSIVEVVLRIVESVNMEIDLDPFLFRSLLLLMIVPLLVLDLFSAGHLGTLNAVFTPRLLLLRRIVRK